ncbi:hypothetical protein D3C87_820480 [compost metagenome]
MPSEKQIQRVVNQHLNGLYMKNVMQRRGWSKDQASKHLLGYLMSGQSVSLAAYLDGV